MTARSTASDDLITATRLEETIEGGTGDDDLGGNLGGNLDGDLDGYLDGNLDGDTIIFSRGDGHDLFLPSRDDATPELHGHTPAEVDVARDPFDSRTHILTFQGTDDRITIAGEFSSPTGAVSWIVFDDGTIWSSSTILAQLTPPPAPGLGTDAAEVLVGTDGNDTVEGAGGDDLIRLQGGDDIVVFSRGDGVDTIARKFGGTL